jgi:hypothetical protein
VRDDAVKGNVVVIAPARRAVYRRDVDGERAGCRIEVGAAIERAAVVFHLESDADVGHAVAARGWRESELAGGNIGQRNELANSHRRAIAGDHPQVGPGGELYSRECVGRVVKRIAEAEVGRGEGIGRVFENRGAAVRAAGRGGEHLPRLELLDEHTPPPRRASSTPHGGFAVSSHDSPSAPAAS